MSFLLLLDYILIIFSIVLFNINFIVKDNIASNDGIIIEKRIRKGVEGSDCRRIQDIKSVFSWKSSGNQEKGSEYQIPGIAWIWSGTTNHLTVMFNTELSLDTIWSIPAPSWRDLVYSILWWYEMIVSTLHFAVFTTLCCRVHYMH